MNKKIIALCLFSLLYICGFGQNIGIGQWRTLQSYRNSISVANVGNKVYCANKNGLFIYDKVEKTITPLSKENGLSDIGISQLKYYKDLDILIIAYNDANIDFIQNNQISNFSDIKHASISDFKKIINIDFYGNYAYISCSFGIVVVDLIKKEVKDTYYIGSNGDHIQVNDIAINPLNDSIYAATNTGIFAANFNSTNLVSFENWNLIPNQPKNNAPINFLIYFDGCLIANNYLPTKSMDSAYLLKNNVWTKFDTIDISRRYSMEIFNNKLNIVRYNFVSTFSSANQSSFGSFSYWGVCPSGPIVNGVSVDNDGEIWIADKTIGLIHNKDWNWENIKPEGPGSTDVCKLKMSGQTLWVATGGVDASWGNSWLSNGLYRFKNGKWTEHNKNTIAGMDTIFDIINLAITPNSDEHIYACSWARGLVEINDNTFVKEFKETNSTLENIQGVPGYYWLGVGGAEFDNNGNLWVTNSGVTNELCVKKPNGTWLSFNINNVTAKNTIADILIDSTNQKWMLMPKGNIAVFNDNNTIDNTSDDRSQLITTSPGSGNLPSSTAYCMAKDRDGKIWVGTDKGICVFYNPEKIFTNENWDAQQILVEQDGYYQYLLEFEIVTSIAVDGANRKWLGTQNAGVFLVSADGLTQIQHFTKDNSPLISNYISSIAINSVTGEVFIGTDNGICSYMGTATKGAESMSALTIYPNPVKPNYNGAIAIRGLVTDANVKITDIAGSLVYETTANGGEAIWNGCNMSGKKVNTGIYMVYCTNSDGSSTKVGKILFER